MVFDGRVCVQASELYSKPPKNPGNRTTDSKEAGSVCARQARDHGFVARVIVGAAGKRARPRAESAAKCGRVGGLVLVGG